VTGPAPASGQRRGTGWLRLALVFLGVALLLVVAAVSIRLAPLLLAPNRYAGVTSIEHSADYRDAALMNQAWRLGVASRYTRIPYEYQHNQSFCGPTSVADVLHSLGDAQPQDRMLEGTNYTTWFGYLPGGLTLDQVADVLHKRSGRPVRVLRGLTLDQFRAEMGKLNDPQFRYIANFQRGPLFGHGHGHFSPLLGYIADRDLVLVGDVNPAYRPFLVSTERLWEAVDTVDGDTGKKRGLVVLTNK
jgi:hypothetical protein